MSQYTAEMIDYRLDTSRDLVPEKARYPLAKALSLLPEDVVDFIIENYSFVSMEAGTLAEHYTFDHFSLKGREGFILIDRTLWRKSQRYRAFYIAHEVAHAYLKHGVQEMDQDTSIESRNEAEKEADELAVKWLSKHYSEVDLRKYTYVGRGLL